ncbi:MAG: hypothetical protein M9885_12300 [Burkholderiaceae bacterium]|nr:hypothetical protein [Burkholderiaceae bacterium]
MEDLDGYKELLYLSPTSPSDQRQALELMARYFKNEFRYDWMQYCAEEHDDDCAGVLMCEKALDLVKDFEHHPNRVVGGACFRKKDSGGYVLDWIWLHPFARNRKKLKRLWPIFKGRYGDFTFAEPLSAHMAYFVKKHG